MTNENIRWHLAGVANSPFMNEPVVRNAYYAARVLEKEHQILQAKLKQALELIEIAAQSSPYPQGDTFWKRVSELEQWIGIEKSNDCNASK